MNIQAKLVNGEVIEQFVDSDICVIGRSSKSDVVIPHEGMSRQHCQIEIINGEYFVTDLGSTNGVLIDNIRIEPHQKVPYQTFLPLSFGAVQNLVIQEEAGSASVSSGSDSSNDGAATGFTRTRPMREQPVKTPVSTGPITRPDLKIEKNAKIRLWLSAAGGALLILAAAVWYIYQEQETANKGFELIHKDPSEIEEKNYDQF